MDKDFLSVMLAYKQLIDDDIALYCDKVTQQSKSTYGEPSFLVASTFADILSRGGKRMRGVLTLIGYEMCGGTNQAMIIQAARAVEMMQAYILIIDDIQDRSDLRRGGPSAHKLLEAAHKKQNWQGDAPHTGTSLSLNAALLGLHDAEVVLTKLDVDQELRLKALLIMNHTMMVTIHGQTHDIVNEIKSEQVELADVENVLQWKTAHYTVLNPIHMGMVLAGAPCEDTNAISQYSLHTGKAFQIVNDLQVIGPAAENDKPASEDIREGKQTLLTVHALRNASTKDTTFLRACLGNQKLTESEFQKCRKILINSGAVDYAQKIAAEHIDEARKSLNQHAKRWTPKTVKLLDDLAVYLLTRSK